MKRFQWIAGIEGGASRPDFDRPTMATPSFVVLPTLGSLVPGWLLVVPRRPIENLAMLTPSEKMELEALKANLKVRLSAFPGVPYFFEHGGVSGSVISCGVDQAHMHAVPLPFDLIKSVQGEKEIEWQHASLGDSSMEYLWVSDGLNTELVGTLRQPTSQWFRKHIAAQLGRSSEWDYRTFPHFDNMVTTSNVLT